MQDHREPAKRLPPDLLATCVIPWSGDWRLQEEQFRSHIELIASQMTRQIYIFGTAGEGYAVTEPQFSEIATIFADQARISGVDPMLGVIGMSLGNAVARINVGLKLGIRKFQISFPGWGRLSDGEVRSFFRSTCGQFPDAIFLHYNTPRGGRVLTGSEYRMLAAEFPNLAAVKFSSRDAAAVRELVEFAAPLQCFLTEFAYSLARDHAECGLLISLSGVSCSFPRRFAAARGGDLRAMSDVALRIYRLLMDSVAGDDPQPHMDGAFEKLIARAHGANVPLRLLPPFAGPSERAAAQFLAGLESIRSVLH